MKFLLRISLAFVFSSLSASATTHELVLPPGGRLPQGRIGSTTDGRCHLLLQSDGNLVVKKDGRNAWSSGTDAHEGDGPFHVKLQRGGALTVRTTATERRGNNQNGGVIFSTNTRGTRLDDERGGGLYFNTPDCTLTIKADDVEHDVWTNVRDRFYGGNRLERGGMIRYPPNDPRYTLLLQHDGNLILFGGTDMTDYGGPDDILWGAGVMSADAAEDVFLRFTCEGRLVLNQKIGNAIVPYWNETVVTETELEGYSLVLRQNSDSPFGYEPLDADCSILPDYLHSF